MNQVLTMSCFFERWFIILIWLYSQSPNSIMSGFERNASWIVGRIPPSKFEYEILNGEMTEEKAIVLCENDLQCGGFTFKGTRRNREIREVYFFHFIHDETSSLEDYRKYPHWTSYIVASRDCIVLSGHYLNKFDDDSTHIAHL